MSDPGSGPTMCISFSGDSPLTTVEDAEVVYVKQECHARKSVAGDHSSSSTNSTSSLAQGISKTTSLSNSSSSVNSSSGINAMTAASIIKAYSASQSSLINSLDFPMIHDSLLAKNALCYTSYGYGTSGYSTTYSYSRRLHATCSAGTTNSYYSLLCTGSLQG